ncbi:MAG: DUF4397 domain-containing protein [Chitinophagaceae bacterium]
MKTIFSSFRLPVLAVLTVFAFSACNKLDDDDIPDAPVSGLMAFNLAPDVSQAAIALSGSSITPSPLAFNSYTGGYLAVYSGDRSIESYNYGLSSSLATSSHTFAENQYYSVFVVGANSNYRHVVVADNLDELSGSGQAFVRYINAIPDSSRPSVTITAGGSNIVNDNAAFASVSGFVAANAGDATVSVTNGGTINANRTITLEQGKIYTVLLTGIPGTGDGVQIRYIQNGTVDQDAGRSASSSGRSSN